MDALRGHAPTSESGLEVLQECGRAAQIKIGFAGNVQLFEDRGGQPAGRIEVNTQLVSRVGPAVLDVAPGMGQLSQHIACFSGKEVIQAIARSVDPPDWARRRV